MNLFSYINPEINDDKFKDEEIDGEKKYRNVKKKIRRLKEKDLLTEEQEKKLRILGILVQEYENRNKGIPEKKAQPKKKKKKSTNKEEEDLLNREYEKNKDYWEREERERELKQKWRKEWQKEQEKRERKLKEEWEREQEKRERKLKEEWEREQKKKEQQQEEQHWSREQWWREQQKQHHQHQQRQQQQKQQNNNYNTYRKKSPEEKFCENYNIEVPQDIINLYRNYSTKKYRELALKYHPDKGNNNIEYQKMINNIKDIFK